VAKPLPLIDRRELAKVFTNQKTLLAIEATLRQAAQTLPMETNQAYDAATGAQISADDAQADATDALSLATALLAPSYVTLAPSALLTGERVLQGGTGVTLPVVGANVTITVNVPTALGYVPANKAGEAFTGPVSSTGNITSGGVLRGLSLRLDATPTASTTVSSHYLPIDCNGTTYYLRLSATP
jgi:hypothetical protein